MIIVVAILLIGLLLMINSGIFTNSWVSSKPFVSYYLGSVNPAAGFISAVFLLIISGIISYNRDEKYSHEQIDLLRRM